MYSAASLTACSSVFGMRYLFSSKKTVWRKRCIQIYYLSWWRWLLLWGCAASDDVDYCDDDKEERGRCLWVIKNTWKILFQGKFDTSTKISKEPNECRLESFVRVVAYSGINFVCFVFGWINEFVGKYWICIHTYCLCRLEKKIIRE